MSTTEAENGTGTYRQRLKRRASGLLRFSIVLPLFLTVMFPLVYGFSMHAPNPHHLKVAVVAADAQGRALAQPLDSQSGGEYDVQAVSSVEQAEQRIRSLDVRAAWDPTTNTVYVASMGSTSATQFAEGYFKKVAPSVLGARAPSQTVQDLVPPPENDGLGMSLMFMGLPALMAGYMLAMGLRSNLAKLSARVAIPIMAVAALFFATVPTFIAYSVYGAFTTAALPVFCLMAFASFTFMLFHTGGMRMIGLYMALPTMFVLVMLGIPASGAGMATELVPPVFASLHHWLPTPALLDAMRRLIYFPDAPVAGDVLTLVLWFFLAVMLLLASFLRRPRPEDADATEAERAAAEQDSEGSAPPSPVPATRAEARALRGEPARQGFTAAFGTRRVVSDEQMANRRGLLDSFKLALMFVVMMPLMYIGAMHHPSPQNMQLDVVVTDQASRQVADRLERLPSSEYDVHEVSSAEDARQDVLHDRVRAAYVPASGAEQARAGLAGQTGGENLSGSAPVVMVASANGVQAESAVLKLFGSLTPGHSPETADLAPTTDHDRFGMSLIYLGMGGIVGSNIAGMMIGLAGRGWGWFRRIRWVLGVAAANTLAQYAISVWVVQFLPRGTDWTVWAILFLMSVSIQFFAVGGALLVRNTVNIFTIGIFVMCGVPSSGLFLPLDLAPLRYTWLHHVVPSSAALGAIRTQVYLPEAPIGKAVAIELVWLVVGLGVYAWGCWHVARLRRKDALAAEAEEAQYDDAAPGEFESAVLTGSPGPETRQMKAVAARKD